MKKTFIALLIIASTSSFAQITLQHTYPHAGTGIASLRLVNLSSSGYKYYTNDTSSITLYNLNHTIFRTINIPALNIGFGSLFVSYVSEQLFNTNPADIEYFVQFTQTGSSIGHSRVFDDVGNVLFSQDSTNLGNSWAYNGNQNNISYTPSGWVMILPAYSYNDPSYVYSLPGTLPCEDCSNSVVASIGTNNNNNGMKTGSVSNYPNPTSGQTTVAYEFPQGVTVGDLVFYDMAGREVKRFKVSSAFSDIVVTTSDLAAGTYYYELQAANGFSAGRKMVVIK